MTDAGITTRLLDGVHLSADLVKCGADRLMVTFDCRRQDRDGFGPVVPSEQFARAGFDQPMIAARDNDWFINTDTVALESVCRDLRNNYHAAQAIGLSMDGFGAFRFSRVLGLSHVVAVSPQVSIAPQRVPFETRGEILIDPFNLNVLTHARMLQVLFLRVALFRLPGGGHPCTRILRGAQLAGLIHARAIAPARGPSPVQAAHRTAPPARKAPSIGSDCSVPPQRVTPFGPASRGKTPRNWRMPRRTGLTATGILRRRC
jgi:hypothetical protein